MMMHFILLRGLAREAGHWLEFPDTLRQQLDADCQIHCIDFPGCGTYCTSPALNSISAMTEHARRESSLHSGLPLPHPLYLVGISMGGMVALDWAHRFPQEVQGLVLINTSAGDQPFWWRLRPGAWLTMLLAMLLSPDQREAWVLRKVSNRPIDYQQRHQQWRAIQRQHPITRATIVTMLSAAAAFKPRLQLQQNGLILCSKKDRLVSINASNDLAQRLQWPLEIHPDAGHDLPLDDAQWVAQRIAQWLAQQKLQP
jgi:pimeloyl-[acyl-carrier protein] methyl ester esterase